MFKDLVELLKGLEAQTFLDIDELLGLMTSQLQDPSAVHTDEHYQLNSNTQHWKTQDFEGLRDSSQVIPINAHVTAAQNVSVKDSEQLSASWVKNLLLSTVSPTISSHGSQFFTNAQGITVENSQFTKVEGDFICHQLAGDYHSHNYNNEEGFKTLVKVIVPNTLHTLSECSTTRCHPRTREKIISVILTWINNYNSPEDILWLHGTAGTGKSTIMQEIAELCMNCPPQDCHCGGTFFFSRGKPGQEDDNCLFATLAYQLSLYDLELREHVNRAMTVDPILYTKDTALQLHTLIFEPLKRLPASPSMIPFVITDGLDECKSQETQICIIETVANTLLAYDRRIRFIITSRSEVHIREIFEQPKILRRTRLFALDSHYNPDRDIRLFLEERLDAIAKQNKSIMSKMMNQWPQPSDIDDLVKKSCRQFLYASTVLEFVGAKRLHPVQQLKKVFASTNTPDLYSNIDKIYIQILKTCPEPISLNRIFGLLLTLHCPQPPEVYNNILGLDPETGGVNYVLHGLHSVIKFSNSSDDEMERHMFKRRLEYDKTGGLRFHHASVQDFLLDKNRSKEFFVDLSATHAALVKSGFSLMTKWISSPWKETWGYLKHHMGTHLAECQADVREGVLEDLHKFNVKFPPPKLIEHPIWDHSFDALHSIVTAFATILTSEDEGRQNLLNPINFHSEHLHWAQECVLSPRKVLKREDSPIAQTYLKFCMMLDTFYKFTLSSSNDMIQLLEKLPGILADMGPINDQWLHDLFCIDVDDLSLNMQRNRKFLNKWKNTFWKQHFNMGGTDSRDDVVLLLNPHFTDFLCNRDRAGIFYRDHSTGLILDYYHIIRMIFRPDWLAIPRSCDPVTYLNNILRKCLESISIKQMVSCPNDHPITQLIRGLKQLHYDKACLQKAPVSNVDLIWSATRCLLDWIQRQHKYTRQTDKSKGAYHRIRKDLAEISTHIYNQILQVDSPKTGGRLITICNPFRVAISQDFECETPSTLLPPPSLLHPEQLMISETLLSLHGIRSSLLAFLTKPERAGSLYFTPDAYHTQFAEICLEHCDPSVSDISRDWITLPSHTEWRHHLIRAKPNENILSRLHSIPPGPWLAEGLPTGESGVKTRSIMAIIEWLEKDPENPNDISERWTQILSDFKRVDRWRRSQRTIRKTNGKTDAEGTARTRFSPESTPDSVISELTMVSSLRREVTLLEEDVDKWWDSHGGQSNVKSGRKLVCGVSC